VPMVSIDVTEAILPVGPFALAMRSTVDAPAAGHVFARAGRQRGRPQRPEGSRVRRVAHGVW
jgi:hypothetical protein